MPVTSMRLVTLVFVLVACTRATESNKDPIKPPDPVPVPVVIAESRTVVLEADRGKKLEYLAVTVGTDRKAAPTIRNLGLFDAIPSGASRRALAAHDGVRWVRQDGRSKLVVDSTIGRGTGLALDAGVEPHALHVVGNAIYVGSDREVCWIDLGNQPNPKCVELVNRSTQAFKAYDRFVRLGNRLLAIDDEVMPLYADWFSIDAGGKPVKRLGDWLLPGVINGHYDHAALLATGPNAFTLFLVAPYGIMSGTGHDLAAVPIRDDKLVFDPGLTLQNADNKTPILEEHSERGGGKPDRVLAGMAITPWRGIAVTPDGKRLVIAAGTRGLLAVPADFAPGTKTATAHLTGLTDVLDVRTQSGLLLVLVDRQLPTGNPASVAELLVVDPTTLEPTARHVLPARYDRFVD